ncbi:hypothetical protein [uncultured Draconibacterium sp.]|uniref:glycosyltransferase n=1 Tax=uncultured Draconibacterium sp. TaxID=1573823 RepID=UPI0029C630F6|nr:hypothetical protein [uncultured Draconibacterium sp.]
MENIPDKKAFIGEKYIFSGGYSNRDYELLFKCISQNPDMKFVIVASALNKDITDIPANATVYKDTSNKQFNTLLGNAYGVIIPLKKDVGASGQLLSLLAMQMHKPIIYCNISVVNYYFVPYKTGIPYQLNNIKSLNKALQTLMDPDFEVGKMTQDSFKRCSEKFTLENRNLEFMRILKADTSSTRSYYNSSKSFTTKTL